MKTISLSTAVGEICQAVEDTPVERSPFFFLVGSGISAPGVPTATQIALHCRTEAQRRGRGDEPGDLRSIDLYSHWFERAYPQPIQRQGYLRKLIEGTPITHANLRLAHLLTEKRLGALVVTPNFDDFLGRALALFGQASVMCDHPRTVERINPESADIQVLHVHGSYLFYDCCNLRGEIEDRAKAEANSTLTVSSTLDRILYRRSPLVLGYGGWEGDVIMNALERRLKLPLPVNLYWFCYRTDEAPQLPAWLRDHPQVRFVVPPTREVAEGGHILPGRVESGATGGASAPRSTDDGQPTLSAQQVLDALIHTLNLPAPFLTRDPLSFFAQQLRASLPPEDPAEPDVYALASVVQRIEHAATGITTVDVLEVVRDAVRRSDYGEAISRARGVFSSVPVDRLSELIEIVWSASASLLDDSQDEIDGYTLIVEAHDRLSQEGASVPAQRALTAKALVYKGFTLGTLNRSEEAVTCYDEVVRRFGDAQEPALREQVAKALFNKSVTLGTLNRSEEEVTCYDEVVRRFGDAQEPALREQVAMALVNKGIRLGTLNRSEEAVTCYDEVVRRFGDAQEPGLRERVARALVGKGFRLGTTNRSEEAVTCYDEVVRRFGDAQEPGLREQVAKALFNKGVTLGTLNRSEEEVICYDEVVRRFGNPQEPALREQVAMALVNKGIRLGTLNRSEEAVTCYDEVVRRFADAQEPALRERVAIALVNKSVTLGTLNRSEEAVTCYDEVVRRFGDAEEPALRKQVAMALFNKSVTLGELNRSEEEVTCYDEVVRRFGDAQEPALREQVAVALFNKSVTLETLSRSEEAVTCYDEVVRRFGDAQEPALREWVAMALVSKGVTLETLNRSEEAVTCYDEVVRRFGDAQEPALREQVAIARANIARFPKTH